MDSFPLFHDQYYDKWKICPPIGSNMADNIPLITLFGSQVPRSTEFVATLL
jgi:hypothetical protein